MGGQPSILALDLATTTGYAWGPLSAPTPTDLERANGATVSEPIGGFKSFKNYSPVGPRLAAFRDWMEDLMRVHNPSIVVFEAPIPRQTNAQTMRILISLAGITEELATRYMAKVYEVEVKKIKKHATGNGNADKEDMIHQAKLMGWHPKDDNHADALWLLDYSRCLLGGA